MKRLDLGGTACYEDPRESVSISLDGSNSDDMLTPVVVGDYTRCPFPNNTFDEAFGCCVLEGDYVELQALAAELLRVMKPGARVIIKGCDEPSLYKDTEPFLAAGFVLIEDAAVYHVLGSSELAYDNPFVYQIPERRSK